MKKVFNLSFFVIMGFFLIKCAGEPTQLHIKDAEGISKTVEFPKGTITGAASKEQATTLAQIFVDSHNMVIAELSEIKAQDQKMLANQEELKQIAYRIEENIKKLDATNQEILRTSKSYSEIAQKTLQLIEEMSKRHGTGEITIFFPVGKSRISENSLEYERLVRFVDFLSRESKGRKILFVTIGSASAFGSKKHNLKLAEKRAKFVKEVIEKYLVNIPHEFYKVYGIGDLYSPKNVPMKEHQKYQHARIIAFFETEQIPSIPQEIK